MAKITGNLSRNTRKYQVRAPPIIFVTFWIILHIISNKIIFDTIGYKNVQT